MSLIHEYGENKYKNGKEDGIGQGIESIIVKLLESGDDSEVIARKTDISLEKIFEIEEKMSCRKENNTFL